jgi:hypothetical protein
MYTMLSQSQKLGLRKGNNITKRYGNHFLEPFNRFPPPTTSTRTTSTSICHPKTINIIIIVTVIIPSVSA